MTARAVLALTGGVGGAKLGLGLTHCLPAENLGFVVNTGDDFEHLGLHISPDLDTLLYTLSGQANPDTGWGRRDETWQCMAALRDFGGEDWFNLGDRDLATHLLRSSALAAGTPLGDITARLAAALGVTCDLLPMSDDPVRTVVATKTGELAFQHYFVRERCAPAVAGFRFDGAAEARVHPDVLGWLQRDDLDAIVICPSNPFVSIAPILALPGLVDALRAAPAPVLAVTPIIEGAAVKGPTAKMMAELAVPTTATAVAEHYLANHAGLLDGFVLDSRDAALQPQIEALGLAVDVTDTLMTTLEARRRLADACLAFATRLGRRASHL